MNDLRHLILFLLEKTIKVLQVHLILINGLLVVNLPVLVVFFARMFSPLYFLELQSVVVDGLSELDFNVRKLSIHLIFAFFTVGLEVKVQTFIQLGQAPDLGQHTFWRLLNLFLQLVKSVLELWFLRKELCRLSIMIGSFFPQGNLFSQVGYQLLLWWVLGCESLLQFADALLSEFDYHLITDTLLLIGFKGLL